MAAPYVFCVDVGSPKNVGWADNEGRVGCGSELGGAMMAVADRLRVGQRVALGFEAPIWTPRRSDFQRITGGRGGVETQLRRPWSAGAGCGVLGAALALIPWCLALIAEAAPSSTATTLPERFATASQGLLVWEAFVSGTAKGLSHHNDAEFAVAAFMARYPDLYSDVPPEPAINHAADALTVSGFSIGADELGMAGLVVAAAPRPSAFS